MTISRTVQIGSDLLPLVNPAKIDFKQLSSTAVHFSQISNTSSVYITNTNTLTSNISFVKSIQYNFGSTKLPASSTFTYNGYITSTATGSVTALYELLRGYLYRNDGNTANPTISSVIQSRTSTSALTGFRLLMLSHSLKADNIIPGSFKMSMTPVNISQPSPQALSFPNSGVTDNTTTGAFAAVSNDDGLSGSLSATLSAFTILIKMRTGSGGAPLQTLFHRRVADKSLSAIGALTSIDSRISMWKYGDLIPLSSSTAIVYGALTWNYLQPPIVISSLSTAVIQLTNIGGGNLYWAASANGNSVALSTSVTSGTISSNGSNVISTTATITAYSLNSNFGQGTEYGYVTIYNNNIYQQSPFLPMTFKIEIDKQ